MTQQYDYESLGPDRFQQLCQAVLVKCHPNVQCFPVGMPDGGRDAVSPTSDTSDAIIFQVKFRKPTPNKLTTADDICSWMEGHLSGELSKIESLINRGAKSYIVMTNAQSSSHLDGGTRDRMQNWLNENIAIPSQIWWRDDIDRRLDGETDIKRTYGILRDVAGLAEMLGVIPPASEEHDALKIARSDRRVSALRKYLRHQYERDHVIKFKQAELKPELLDVFVDVPAVQQSLQDKYGFPSSAISINVALDLDGEEESGTFDRWKGLLTGKARSLFAESRGTFGTPAATYLLRDSPDGVSSKYVLEGAPGQGKSTLSQYICQVHRARLLGLDDEISRFPPTHRSSPLRLPFHVDLRDLSTWLRREDPFNVANDGAPENWSNSVEAFLAAQVCHESGGMNFSVADLDSVTSATPVLLVLDGLDEVPDLADRKNVVNAVNDTVTRMTYSCPSMITVVTSRPSGFARTPGFSKKDYTHLVMTDLPLPLVLEYTDGWLRSRDIPHKEAHDIRRVLGEKLGHPHIVDLARNPMQLAILLWLVNRKGLSLPDKRTALYGAYMETFLDREAEKSEIVRDERDLILELHGYIAWHLHCQAELGKSRGSIAESKLKALLKKYLANEDYQTDLVDQLFTGMTQRVMVLTSRVQHTFEFEVQPLREYFAARYLYSTARPSPPGAERSGTRSDRFEALLRNPYWWNVTRFYAGFSDKGELANLVDLLEDLYTDGDFSLVSYPRQVTLTLLRDQVFSQRPRSAYRALDLVTSDSSLMLLYANQAGDSDRLAFGEGYGGYDLATKMEQRVEKGIAVGFLDIPACSVLAANRSSFDNCSWWFDKWSNASTPARKDLWFAASSWLGTLASATSEQLAALSVSSTPAIGFWQKLLDSRFSYTPQLGSPAHASMVSAIRSGGLMVNYPYYTFPLSAFEMTAAVISREFFGNAYRRHGVGATPMYAEAIRRSMTDSDNGFLTGILASFLEFVLAGGADKDLKLWESTHSAISEALGGACRYSQLFALQAGNVRSGNVSRSVGGDLLDTSLSLVMRFRYARQRRYDTSWWKEQVDSISSVEDAWNLIAALLAWGPRVVLTESARKLDAWVRHFTYEDLLTLANARFYLAVMRQNSSGEKAGPEIIRGVSHQMQFLASLDCAPHVATARLDAAMRKSKDHSFKALYAQHKLRYVMAVGYDDIDEESVKLKSIQRALQYVASQGHVPYYRRRKFSGQTARRMLDHANQLPALSVSQAEQMVMAEISRKATPLATVAKRDHWFDLPD
ncbi:NACHT domain-containing protein [Streptomyces nigrescens]|uniref:NACHT domain-containing protein n=1 Tax=Streptomyces nigrescens TaxID=1920 RepID=UPI0036B7F292